AQRHQAGTLGRPKLDCQLLFRSASGSSIGHSLAAFGSLEAVEPVVTGRLGVENLEETATKLKAANFRLQWSMAALGNPQRRLLLATTPAETRSSAAFKRPSGTGRQRRCGSDSRQRLGRQLGIGPGASGLLIKFVD
uniref:Kinesin motor domain-containing protein n=1 Tax=Macrostomum lignano TaxID=282301 RepID=A0A1I8FDQ5_9PLAT